VSAAYGVGRDRSGEEDRTAEHQELHGPNARGNEASGQAIQPTADREERHRVEEAWLPDDRAVRPCRSRGRTRVDAPDHRARHCRDAERLHAHAAFREVDEVAFALPFTFEEADYVQILTDMATKLGPALGWTKR
jgi:hypothetical protein